MKKLILIAFVLVSTTMFGQKFMTPFNVPTTSTAFGKSVPAGTIIYVGGVQYVTNAAAGSTSTVNSMLTAGTAALVPSTAGDTSYLHSTGTDVAYGNYTFGGTVGFNGNVAVNTNKFNVAASSGNTTIAGTLVVTGAGTVQGNFAVDTNSFTVATGTGNTVVGGTLSATGDFKINTNKFAVTASNGNTNVAGAFTVATNKFAVAATGEVTGVAVLRGTGTFSAALTRTAVSIPGATTNDIYVVSPAATATDATRPVAGDLLNCYAKADSLIIMRQAGTTANLKFYYIRMK